MLWSVTQTAETLSTGDHSVPRMDAQICKIRDQSSTSEGGDVDEDAHMAVGIDMLCCVQRRKGDRQKIGYTYGMDGWSPRFVYDELDGGR